MDKDKSGNRGVSMLQEKICIIGSGNMAEALIKGMINNKAISKEDIFIINPVDREGAFRLKEKYGVDVVDKENILKCRIVILTFKPQDFNDALEMYQEFIGENHVVISILAGVSTDLLQKAFGFPLAVVRVMPNLALEISESATVYSLGEYATDLHGDLTEKIFNTVGLVKRVREQDIDAVTAVAGSGPAYIFYLLESMIEGGCWEGLDKKEAEDLAVQTLFGAALLLKSYGENPGELRKRIASAGGTTEAAVESLKKRNFKDIVAEAVSAAAARSKELGKQLYSKI